MRNGTAAVAVEDPSQIGEVRRVAMRVAQEAGLDESRRSDIGIVATEAATNVVRHAGRGEVLISQVERSRPWGAASSLTGGSAPSRSSSRRTLAGWGARWARHCSRTVSWLRLSWRPFS